VKVLRLARNTVMITGTYIPGSRGGTGGSSGATPHASAESVSL